MEHADDTHLCWKGVDVRRHQLWYNFFFISLNLLFFSDCWWWNISRVKTRRRRPFTNGWRLHSQQVAWSSYELTSSLLNKIPFLKMLVFFSQVWSHHPQPQELEPLRPTNHPTNIGRCCCWNRTSTIVSKTAVKIEKVFGVMMAAAEIGCCSLMNMTVTDFLLVWDENPLQYIEIEARLLN